jgi:hypothetical protein
MGHVNYTGEADKHQPINGTLVFFESCRLMLIAVRIMDAVLVKITFLRMLVLKVNDCFIDTLRDDKTGESQRVTASHKFSEHMPLHY